MTMTSLLARFYREGIADRVSLLWHFMFGVAAMAVVATYFDGYPRSKVMFFETKIEGDLRPGGILNSVFTIERTRSCPVNTGRFLWRWVDYKGTQIKQSVLLTGSSSPFTGEGTQTAINTLPIPSFVPPGTWIYSARSVENCGWLTEIFSGPHTIAVDSKPFEIKP